jgi:hypothetical protein
VLWFDVHTTRAVLLLALWALGCGRSSGGAPVAAYPQPGRAEQAPIVRVQEIVEADSLLGRRVRVTGTCGLAGTGPSTGVWVLQADGFAIEVRGLVPRSCFRGGGGRLILTIFAQIEPKGPDSEERLLLRLPD